MSKTIIVTGGANGVGEALVIELLRMGHHVINIDIDYKKLQLQKEIYPSIEVHCCDLSKIEFVKETIKSILSSTDHIDVLINNAAKQYVETIETLDIGKFKEVLDLNLVTPAYLMKSCSPFMKSGSSIINISSVHGEHPRTNKYGYDVSKAALNLLTKEFSLALAQNGINVNAVLLGATRTPMNEMFADKNVLESTVKKIPLGRVAETEDIVKLVLFLVEENTYSTGSLFVIDGGRSNYPG